jgi:phosphatidate cytidylyltransferase
MLRQRVITAVVLLALLLPAMAYSSSLPFAVLTLLLMAAAGWEWGRLNGLDARRAGMAAALLAVVLLLLHGRWGGQTLGASFWTLLTLLWVAVLVVALRQGVSAWVHWPRPLRWLFGYAVLAAAWWALVSLHAQGLAMLLSALLLVWVADIAAYFGGKAWGRRRLAPQISPGKSWEGALCGALAVLVLAAVWAALARGALGAVLQPALYPALVAQQGWLALPLLLGLTALSVAGDLFESLVKRSAGVKDSSGLLPGHGGVLDRIDALLPVLPAVMAVLAH